jgi:hypothetical protein
MNFSILLGGKFEAKAVVVFCRLFLVPGPANFPIESVLNGRVSSSSLKNVFITVVCQDFRLQSQVVLALYKVGLARCDSADEQQNCFED